MRVIAGEFRSRRLKAPPGNDVRPTPDRLRESLFMILAPRLEGCVFLDGYAGCGSVGIEALSRGARRAIFVERGRKTAGYLRDNLHDLGVTDRAEIILGRTTEALKRRSADIVFLDPPYSLDAEYENCLALLGAAPPPLLLVQHDVGRTLPAEIGRLRQSRRLVQGDNAVTFYTPA
jgi:16S rRNA (guanine(966)-N(2))-methyltransferase RsmD